MLVRKCACAGKRFASDLLRREIDLGDAPHDEARTPDHLPDRSDDLLRENRRAYRFRQHRSEGRVAFLVDQQQLVTLRQLALQRTGQRGPGKSAADNGDRSCFHDAENPPVLRPIHCPSALDAMEAVILESHPVAHTQVDVARVVDDE